MWEHANLIVSQSAFANDDDILYIEDKSAHNIMELFQHIYYYKQNYTLIIESLIRNVHEG